jgi:hypothetical protein
MLAEETEAALDKLSKDKDKPKTTKVATLEEQAKHMVEDGALVVPVSLFKHIMR